MPARAASICCCRQTIRAQFPAAAIIIHRASSNRQIVGARSLPVEGDVAGAKARLRTIKVYPLNPVRNWAEPKWLDVTGRKQDTTPLDWEDNLRFWEVLHETLQVEPAFEGYHDYYGELAALGIEKGKPFEPGIRMTEILEQAARIANAEMRVQAFGDRRADRSVWRGRQWQWASLRFEDGDFNTATHLDTDAREKWFYQAVGASPAMFRRDAKAGSLYWLGAARCARRLSGRRQALSPDRALAGAGQAVLVGHRL